MFGQVERTAFDFEFSLLGVPVRINPWFWLLALVYSWMPERPDLIGISVMCIFVSILIHEFGHALLARAFGHDPHIVLYLFGGYASFPRRGYGSLWESLSITLAGPVATFVLFGWIWALSYGLARFGVVIPDNLYFTFQFLMLINLFWGIFNLLPILPLDGGQITRDLLLFNRRIDGELLAAKISLVIAIGLAVFSFQYFGRQLAVFLGLLAFMNFQTLSSRNQRW